MLELFHFQWRELNMRQGDRCAQIHEMDFRIWFLRLNENFGCRKVVVRNSRIMQRLEFRAKLVCNIRADGTCESGRPSIHSNRMPRICWWEDEAGLSHAYVCIPNLLATCFSAAEGTSIQP